MDNSLTSRKLEKLVDALRDVVDSDGQWGDKREAVREAFVDAYAVGTLEEFIGWFPVHDDEAE